MQTPSGVEKEKDVCFLRFRLSVRDGGFAFALITVATRPVVPRQPSPECQALFDSQAFYHDHYSAACNVLTSECINRIYNGLVDLWNDRVCLAAATCQGTEKTVGIGACISPEIAALGHEGLPTIKSDLFLTIVTDCRTAPGRCVVTQQQYVDFFYGTLSLLGSTVWSDLQSEVIGLWWASIRDWAGTGDVVPYGNFDDWFHFSHS
uniref:Uncharacterized protein n=1 Tax=Moniliophthora roreri TaxID=221103 RepID=A0A0W0F1B8_MONRR